MNKHPGRLSLLTLLALTGLLASPANHADTTNCTVISSIPATISTSGIYCLMKDFDNLNLATGAAITIAANAVTLDLNGHRLRNANAGVSNIATGITETNLHDITIRNGIVAAFSVGIIINSTFLNDLDVLSGIVHSHNEIIEDMHIDSSTSTAIRGAMRDTIIRNNIISDTGTNPIAKAPLGIEISGPGNRVINNDVLNTMFPEAGSTGILFPDGNDNIAINNRIVQAGIGIDYNGGSGKYRDNLTSGVVTPFETRASHGTAIDVGNNN